MPNAYLEKRAELLAENDENTRAKTDMVLDRVFELFDNVGERDRDIWIDEMNKLAEDSDDIESAFVFRAKLTQYAVRTLSDIFSMPPPMRDMDFVTGSSMVQSVSIIQAHMEILGQTNMIYGELLADINKAAAQRLDPAQKEKLAVTGGITGGPGQAVKLKEKPDAAE